jgi:hypothetical protein
VRSRHLSRFVGVEHLGRNARFTRLGAAALVLVLAAVGRATTVHAHGANLVVSCDTTRRAQLQVNGPGDYLDGRTSIALMRGDDVLTGFWFTDAPGISTLSEDGHVGGRRRLGPRHRLALEMIRADRGLAMLEPSTFRVVLARPGQSYEFFHDTLGDFSIQMISRANRPGTYSATFRFVDRAGLHPPSDAFTLRFSTDAPRESLAAVTAATYYDAVRDLRLRLVDGASAIANRAISRAGDQAAAVWSLARALPRLAREADSGVATQSLGSVGALSAAVEAGAISLHRAVDLGDSSASLAYLGVVGAAVDSLAASAPRRFICPMGCESGRTYSSPGHCPVCGAKLMDAMAHLDHNPRHGGEFIMTPDFEHHLEIVPTDGQLRVYVYDEFTRPVAVDSVQARLELPGSSPEQGLTLALGPTSEMGCLVTALPRRGRLPHQATLVLRFAGTAEQSYAVRLSRPKP